MSTCKQADWTHPYQHLYCALLLNNDSIFHFHFCAPYSCIEIIWSHQNNTCGKSPRNDCGQAGNVPLWGVEANDAHRMRLLQPKMDKCLCQASNLESVWKQLKEILFCFFTGGKPAPHTLQKSTSPMYHSASRQGQFDLAPGLSNVSESSCI